MRKTVREWFQNHHARYRAWWDRRRLAREKALFGRLLADQNSGVPKMVDALTNLKAATMVRQFLDARGYAHCQFCLKTDQLRRHGKGWICEDHFQRQKALEDATAAAKTPNASYAT